jgi:hypothetical protein
MIKLLPAAQECNVGHSDDDPSNAYDQNQWVTLE